MSVQLFLTAHSLMQRQPGYLFATLLFLTLTLSGCELIGDIFEAGAWTGIIGVVLVLALIIWLVGRLFGGGRRNV